MRTFFINGYGIPKDILEDGNYKRYLKECWEFIRAASDGRNIRLVLSGGFTNANFPRRTEAAEMQRYLAARCEGYHDALKDGETVIMDWPIDSREALEALRHFVGFRDELVIFCEHARQDWMRIMASLWFPSAFVMAVDFDGGRRWYSRAVHLLKMPIRIVGLFLPSVRDCIELPLRHRFIRTWGERTEHRPDSAGADAGN